MDAPFFIYAGIVVILLAIIGLSERKSNKRLDIIKGQDELLAKQRKLIEEKMTEKVKEAFEKPKRPRKNV